MKFEFEDVAKIHQDKLKKIKVCLFDVDGILTDGKVWYSGAEMGFNRYFNVRDGYGLKLLQQFGYQVGIISGGNSLGVMERFKQLGISFVHLGNEDKRQAYRQILNDTGVKPEETLYMGDEYFDLPILNACGFSATVSNASYPIKKVVDYITINQAGNGAVREVIDILLWVNNHQVKIEEL